MAVCAKEYLSKGFRIRERPRLMASAVECDDEKRTEICNNLDLRGIVDIRAKGVTMTIIPSTAFIGFSGAGDAPLHLWHKDTLPRARES